MPLPVAPILLTPLVSTILGNLNALAAREAVLAWGFKTELQNLKRTFRTVQAVLQDAEDQQWKSAAVNNWLRDLKDAAYDAEDFLDELAIEARRCEQQSDLVNSVRSFLSSHNPFVFRVKMGHKLKNIRKKLDAIASDKNKFHLKGDGDTEADSSDWRLTSSFLNESEIYGREREKEELINLLLNNSDDLSVYAIWGMGGQGKTTLAQMIYNEGRVEGHFDLKIWVCVSVDFNIKRLTRAIFESIEGTSQNIQELDSLKKCLEGKLNGKKFLLVLDDVWDDYQGNWNRLKNVLSCGAKGSSVIITTRIEMVALRVAPFLSQHLERLSDDDSWRLFERFAFGMRSREEYVNLEPIGRSIVNRCGGVPLAIKALGSLMRLKKDENEWLSVKRSEIWDLQEEGSVILPALRLSYTNLPSHLKQCFVFCCIFPKDHVMKKDRLIALWMANGFIPCKGHMDLHDMGHEIFNELVGRSFLQEVKEDGLGNTTCKMHDLMHDLAQSIMLYECCSVEGHRKLEICKPLRHVAVWRNYDAPDCDKFLKFQSLRSFFLHDHCGKNWSEVLHLCFSGQKRLRALDVSNYVEKLPKSICNLKHLRYLDVSGSDIRTLPESTSSLQNLQTLNLRHCRWLLMLPEGMKHLKNLVYLDIKGCCSLRFMPSGMGRLICLRKLSRFVVGKGDGKHIGELERLNNLGGELSIRGLDNVKDLRGAKSANLMGKTALQSLSLSWFGNSSYFIQENIEEVIDGLQPHSNIKKLKIKGYGGSKSPNWMVNLNLMLPNLEEMKLMRCYKYDQLPPFGKLQFLKRLHLYRVDGIKCMGSDVYGDGENPFPSLEELCFIGMSNFEKWENVAGTQTSFPLLRELTLTRCPVLIEVPILSSIKTLYIANVNGKSLGSVRNLTSLTSLEIKFIPYLKLLPDGFLQNHTLLEHLEIRGMDHLQSLSNQMLDNLSSLKSLIIVWCPELESLPEEGLRNLNSLETLEIMDCNRLNYLPANGLCGLSSLRMLLVINCAKFASLSEGVRYLTALEDLHLDGCLELNSLPESIQHLTSLQSLNITYCPNLETRCEKERGEEWPKIAHIPSIHINNKAIQES